MLNVSCNLGVSNSWNAQGPSRVCFLLYRSCGSNNVDKLQFGSTLLSNYALVKPASSAVTWTRSCFTLSWLVAVLCWTRWGIEIPNTSKNDEHVCPHAFRIWFLQWKWWSYCCGIPVALPTTQNFTSQTFETANRIPMESGSFPRGNAEPEKNGVEMFGLQCNGPQVRVYAEFPGWLENFAPWWFLSASPLGSTSPFTGISRERNKIFKRF